jgi:hypothetical protein
MKTSNKLILGLLGFFALIALIALIYVRFFGIGNIERITGNNQVTSESRSVGEYETLEIHGDYTVHLIQGPASITLHGESNLLQTIDLEVKGNRLEIRTASNKIVKANEPLYVVVTHPGIKSIQAYGGSKVKTESGILSGTEIELRGDGAVQFDLNLQYTRCDIHLSGASQVYLSGEGETLEAALNGACNLDSGDFTCRIARIEGNGAGNVTVNATDTLSAELNGAVQLYYKGTPVLKTDTTGASSVNSL